MLFHQEQGLKSISEIIVRPEAQDRKKCAIRLSKVSGIRGFFSVFEQFFL